MLAFVRVLVVMVMRVILMILLLMAVAMIVIMRQMNIELDPGDARFLRAFGMQVITAQVQLLQLVLEPMQIHTQIEQRPDKHVAADTADEIQIKRLHYVRVIKSWRLKH